MGTRAQRDRMGRICILPVKNSHFQGGARNMMAIRRGRAHLGPKFALTTEQKVGRPIGAMGIMRPLELQTRN